MNLSRPTASLFTGALVLAALCLAPAPALADGGYLGVYLTEDAEQAGGALIEEVAAGSPAAKAGLAKGDLVVAVDGQEIANAAQLIPVLVAGSPGQKLALKVERDRWQRTFVVTLSTRPGQPQAEPEGPVRERDRRGYLGVFLAPSGQGGKAEIDGVVEGSPAARAGLKEGDVVLTLDGKALRDPTELIEALGQCPPGRKITLGVQRGQETTRVAVTLGDRPRPDTDEIKPPSEAKVEPARPQPEEQPAKQEPAYLGVALDDAEGKGPLQVTEVVAQSPAERYGLLAEDVIVGIDGQEVKTIEGLVKAFEGKFAGDSAVLRVRRDGWTSNLVIKLGTRPGGE